MMRILKNKTDETVHITCENLTQTIAGHNQADLAAVFLPWQLAACDHLVELLAQGPDKFQLNDGATDLSMVDAIDLVRGYTQKIGLDEELRLRTSIEPRKTGDQAVIVSHNWCDRCTWYGQSVRVTGETLDDYGDGYRFVSSHPYWIDLSHGRLYREDIVSTPYLPKIYVDGYLATERAPFSDSGGDFAIDYRTGIVTFFSSKTGCAVTASYSYENGSMFIVKPGTGKRLWVERSEVQFSADVVITDSTHFQAWAYNPASPPNKIPASSKTTYKTAKDYIDEANGVYPTVPAFGGEVRGTPVGHMVFPFNYMTVKELKSSYGVEIRVWLESNKEFGGTFGTATFYCTVHVDD